MIIQDWENYTDTVKAGLKLVAQGHMDSLRVRPFFFLIDCRIILVDMN